MEISIYLALPGRVNKKVQMFKGEQALRGFVIFLIGVFYFWIGLNLL